MVNYSPSRKGKPFIEGEAEIGGSTRKASVGIVGSSLGNMNQVVGIPKAGLSDTGNSTEPPGSTRTVLAQTGSGAWIPGW